MDYVIIPGTQLYVSRLAFGTASLHRLLSARERSNLLGTALDSGITHFDTAPYYGFGLAEKDISSLIFNRRAAVTVATKVGLYPVGWYATSGLDVLLRKAAGKVCGALSRPQVDWSVRRAEQSLNLSLARMRTDYVDLLYLHEPSPMLINLDEFRRWGERAVESGKARYLGLAGTPHRFSNWLKVTDSFGTVVQSQDSVGSGEGESECVLHAGRPLQFTYGYLRDRHDLQTVDVPARTLKKALIRNHAGAVLFSTRSTVRLRQLVGVFSEQH